MCPQRQHLSSCVTLSVLLSLWMDLTSGEMNIQLIPQYPVIGGSVTLNVTGVIGNILSFIWYKGPSKDPRSRILTYIPNDPSPLITGSLYVSRATPFPNGSLVISDLHITDSGNYTVTIQADRSAASVSVTLTVYELVHKPKVKVSNTLPKESDSLTLTCISSNAKKIIWSRDNTSQLSGYILSRDNTTITFSKVKREDSGDYRCKVENEVSQEISDPYMVAVCYGPEKTQIAVTVYAGSVISLTCSADSVPPPIYQWRFRDRYTTRRSLHFHHVSPEDQGTYTCVANNSVTQSTATASMFLYVNTSTEILNAGSVVGISVGVTLGVVLMITAGVVLYRIHVIKRQKETSADGLDQPHVYENELNKAEPLPAKEESSYMGLQFPSEETYTKLKIEHMISPRTANHVTSVIEPNG